MSPPLATLGKYLRIARQFVRVGVIRKSQFRFEFLNQVVMDTIWYTTHILAFEILYGYSTVADIAGWSVTEVRVFLGFVFVSDAWMMMWLGQGWHFGRELKDGKLDPYRIRPAATVFLYYFQRFSLEACLNMTMAVGYLGYALAQASELLGWSSLVFVPWAIVLSWWARTVLSILFSVFEFFLLNSDVGHLLQNLCMAPAEKPLDIWGHRTRWFFLSLLPVGALTHIPASMVLGKFTWTEAVLHTAWLLVFGILVLRFWKRGFRAYESAMS